MTAIPLSLMLAAACWLALCGAAAFFAFRRFGGFPRHAGGVLLFAGLGLLALAPLTFLTLLRLTGNPSYLGSAVQVAAAVLCFAAAWRARKVALKPEASTGNRTFAEKSAVVVLIALLALSVQYFSSAWPLTGKAAVEHFLGSVVLLVALMIVGHILIALFHHPHADLDAPRDERDRAVDLHSMRNAYYFLVAAFWTVPVLLIAGPPLVVSLNIWFGLLVASEIAYYTSVIAYYRFGTA